MADQERQSLLGGFLTRTTQDQPNSSNYDSSSSPSSVAITRRETRRFLGSKTGHYSVLLLVALDVSCIFADFIVQIFTCEGRVRRATGDTTLEVLSIVSLVFSCLFMLELLASIWAFGLGLVYHLITRTFFLFLLNMFSSFSLFSCFQTPPSLFSSLPFSPLLSSLLLYINASPPRADGPSYFRSKFHIFDATVITTSFVIDVLLRGILEEVASIVIILRLWRVFKIIEELSAGAQDQMEGLEAKLEVSEQENANLRSELATLKTRYEC